MAKQDNPNVPSSGLLNLPNTVDPLVVLVSRAEVEAMNTSRAMKVLNQLIESPDTAKAFVERVDIAFDGYNHTKQELFEIEAVRNFVHQLDQQFPFWLFFLSKRNLGLQCLLFCYLPPFLTEAGRSRVFPEQINNLLSNHWFPAMNHMCKYVSFTEMQVKRLTERAITYFESGRFSHDSEPFA